MCISNISPSPLDSSPQLCLGLLSRGLGLILLIHTEKPCYICNIYSTLTGLIYKNIDPRFSVQGCDIARACEGYITSEDTKPRFYIVLYKNCKCTIYNILYADRLKIHRSIYKNIRPNHIKRLPW